MFDHFTTLCLKGLTSYNFINYLIMLHLKMRKTPMNMVLWMIFTIISLFSWTLENKFSWIFMKTMVINIFLVVISYCLMYCDMIRTYSQICTFRYSKWKNYRPLISTPSRPLPFPLITVSAQISNRNESKMTLLKQLVY